MRSHKATKPQSHTAIVRVLLGYVTQCWRSELRHFDMKFTHYTRQSVVMCFQYNVYIYTSGMWFSAVHRYANISIVYVSLITGSLVTVYPMSPWE